VGRFLVGTGLGVGPPVASLYVTEVKLLFSSTFLTLINGYQGMATTSIFCASNLKSLLVIIHEGLPVERLSMTLVGC